MRRDVVFGAVLAKPAVIHYHPGTEASGTDFKPQPDQVRNARSELMRRSIASLHDKSKKDESGPSGSKIITRRTYPILVELRIAGRTSREIAERIGVAENLVRIHLTRAMADYRSGRLRIREGESIREAIKTGEDRAQAGLESNLAANSPTPIGQDIGVAQTRISIRI